ncbi:hypothetical protein ACFPYJ_05430 [Paenibacillus solisilvae]|uniref:Uncharacterized protein n=1 Tax=Paenibacillus solisilvae TaxID=2486751 RepID=A0ABW0VSL8_9BACL
MINRAGVKAVGDQPSGIVVQTIPKPSGSLYEWTTDTVDFFLPKDVRIRRGAAFYKARLLQPEYYEQDDWSEYDERNRGSEV